MTAMAHAPRTAQGIDPCLHAPEPPGLATMGICSVAGPAFHVVSGGQEDDSRSWLLDAGTSLAMPTPAWTCQRATRGQRREAAR
jgi:hypothetical protein